jgi:hypothetical protein
VRFSKSKLLPNNHISFKKEFLKMKKTFVLLTLLVLTAMTVSAKGGQETQTDRGASAPAAEDNDPSFVPVERALDNMNSWRGVIDPGVLFSIVPFSSSSRAGIIIDIRPGNATNKTVILSVKDAGTTGATLTGSTLNTTGVGTVTITATVPDGLGKGRPFTQDWPIYVGMPPVVKGNYTVRETQSGWILTGYSGREANITIPADLGVTIIADGVFAEKQFITSVVVPEGVIIIGMYAFGRSGSLKSVTLPSSLQIIERLAFVGCEKLESTTIPSGVTVIGRNFFSGEVFGASGLTSITVEAVKPPLINGWLGDKLKDIYVPRASVNVYKNTDGWSQYRDIIKGF